MAAGIVMASGGKLTRRESAQDVVDGVDRLHGGARILERARVDAPRGHVDELAQPERGLEFMAAFTVQDHAERGGAAMRLPKGALDTEERAAPGHEVAHCGHELQHAVGLLGDVHQRAVGSLVTMP